jgi:hypothetical protein
MVGPQIKSKGDPTIRCSPEQLVEGPDGRIKSDHDGVDVAMVFHQSGWGDEVRDLWIAMTPVRHFVAWIGCAIGRPRKKGMKIAALCVACSSAEEVCRSLHGLHRGRLFEGVVALLIRVSFPAVVGWDALWRPTLSVWKEVGRPSASHPTASQHNQ